MKTILKKIYKGIKNPKLILIYLVNKFAIIFNDKFFLQIKFYLIIGKHLNLKNPVTYNEKIQWLKLYDRKHEYTQMVDKYTVKEYVKKIIGEKYIIPTIEVYNNTKDIDWDKLPTQFVMKCTHDSGGIVICKNKNLLDIRKAVQKLNRSLKKDYYNFSREWPYKNVPRRIIVEKYMEDSIDKELKDYKWFCFNGIPKALYIASERNSNNTETKFDFFDMDFNHLPFTNGHPNAINIPNKPQNFELMKHLASKLSNSIPHVRVDFYEIDGQVYFGELTFYHWSGLVPFIPEEWDYRFGKWLELNLVTQ